MNSVQSIEIIPVGAIDVVNPRARNRRIFKEIVTSVAELGLKRPITVKRKEGDGEPRYDLVCGQGRLEAYQALGDSDRGQARELYLSLVEKVTPELRGRFLKVYAYY